MTVSSAGERGLLGVATEPKAQCVAFDTAAHSVALHARMTVPDAMRAIGSGGSTDVASPIKWAFSNKVETDLFVVYSDNESWAGPGIPPSSRRPSCSWAGDVHVAPALRAYRQATGIPAKLAVVNMAMNDVTVADPNDAGSLNVVGFDSGAPQAIREFARGFGR